MATTNQENQPITIEEIEEELRELDEELWGDNIKPC